MLSDILPREGDDCAEPAVFESDRAFPAPSVPHRRQGGRDAGCRRGREGLPGGVPRPGAHAQQGARRGQREPRRVEQKGTVRSSLIGHPSC